MGFTTGAKSTQDIFEEIVTGLLASKVWHNVDTTWSSSTRLIDNNCRRVLAYGAAGGAGKGNTTLSSSILAGTKIIPIASELNFVIGDKIVIGTGNIAEVRLVSAVTIGQITTDANINTDHTLGDPVKGLNFEIYMAVEIINQVSGMYYYSGYYGRGFRFVFSASWDAVAHVYPSSNQSSFIGFETHTGGVIANLATTMVTYWLWIEDNGNGFVIMGKPEPTADNSQESFIIVVERNPTKEYADGYTNFFLYKAGNIWQQLYGGPDTTTLGRDRQILRPFAYQWPDDAGRYSTWYNGYGISFIPTPSYYAYKSNGDNKVYYVKPLIHNVVGQINPIFQSNLFFLWSEGVGLIDGDIIAVEGQTTKYLCKGLDSPDSLSRITYAMKYVA